MRMESRVTHAINILVFHLHFPASLRILSESEGSIYLQMNPKLLPMIFMITADIAGGNATIGEVKWDVAKTTPKDEFCIPTCEEALHNSIMNASIHFSVV